MRRTASREDRNCGNLVLEFDEGGKSRKFAVDMSTTNEKYREDLTAYLLEIATGNGYLKGTLLSTPDLDEAWQRYAPSFYPEAVKEFNGYPEYCLACAGYLGMAVAHLWDKDWSKYMDAPYNFFQSERGFDDMDDYITGNILKETQVSVGAIGYKFEKVNLI